MAEDVRRTTDTKTAAEQGRLTYAFYRARQIFERTLEVIVVALMTVMAVIVISGTFLRYIGFPLQWYDEVAAMLLAWLTYYAAALGAYRGAHIAVPNIVNIMPIFLKLPVVLIGKIFVIGFFILLAIMGFQVLEFVSGDALISLRWFPRQAAMHVIPVGAVLFVLAEILRTPETLRYATTYEQMEDKH